MNQQDLVLQYMQTHAYITSLIALHELAIIQLPARIFRLKAAGVVIKCKMVNGVNRYGQPKRIKRYYLEDHE